MDPIVLEIIYYQTIEGVVMAKKSKFESLSAHRSSPRTRSGNVPEPNSSPRTHSGCVPESISSSKTDVVPRTPFSPDIVTSVGTLRSVILYDWWLTKKEKGFGVAGFESKGGGGITQFSSGAISKRYDSNTLETCDGITVSISDFINRSRSLQNGISLEVCNRFLLGFPYDRNDFDEEESIEKKDDFDFSFDDIPVRSLNDILLSSSTHAGCLRSKILDDVINGLRGFPCPSTEKSDKECEKSEMVDNADDESLVPRVVGAKTRSMLRREEDDEPSTRKRVHKTSKKKRS